ncbi:reverse transcriptase [Tanacetum coccineum]
MNTSLVDTIADYEIVCEVKQLGAYKAPGKDGFPGLFFKKYWTIVGNSVCSAVKQFFVTGFMPSSFNKTLVVLILKIPALEQVGHLRPISLCNFVYHIISKIIANRLKPFIHRLISPQQSAFIHGRLIQDSMVIANEAFHYIRHKNKGNQRLMALKLDLNKAFDRVEWDFLMATLKKMGFADRLCQWILACLTLYELEFLINGESIGNIQPTRGIRQGDPLSSYLFIIIADVLSRMVSNAVDNSLISGRDECQNLVNILARYCSASRQNINFTKSFALFSPNSPEDLQQQLFFWHGDAHGKHIHWLSWDCLSKPKDEEGIGFRDLHSFNLALLAKQGWRLIINPESFWARILKGLYFPKGNFLTASKGSHASWLWQSLLLGRDVLLQGIRWQVGNGEKISFWTHKWVSYNSDFFIREPRGPFTNTSLVSDFIVDGEWDYCKLQQHLFPREVDFVSQIPISNTGAQDKLVWHYDDKGNYSVRSGYRQALLLKEKDLNHASSSSSPTGEFWKQNLASKCYSKD